MFCLGLTIGISAQADIYKCVGESGHAAFADAKTKAAYKDCTLIMRDGSGSASRPARSTTPTPPSFPRVDQQTQKQRDDKRRQILEDELASERKALDDARKNYAEGESSPETYRGQDGKVFRNVPKFEAKMQKLQDDIDLHEKNVQLLEKELDSLK